MLPFIFDDARYGRARRASGRVAIATLITIEFIFSKLVGALHWMLGAALLYACLVLFYTNALLSYVLLVNERGLATVAGLAVAGACIFIFVLFTLVMAGYLVSAVLRLVPLPAASAGGGWRLLLERPRERAAKALAAVRGAFVWRSGGGRWKAFLVLFLSTVLFFHHWQGVRSNPALVRANDILPARVMQDSRKIYDLLRPYVDEAYDRAWPWLKSAGGRGRQGQE